MRSLFCVAATAAVLLAVASAQASVFDFEDGTDQGFGLKFSNDASASFTVATVGGSKRMLVPRTGAFQEADHAEGNTSTDFYQAMLAASGNEAGYQVSYDYYIDTSTFGAGAGTFLQMGSYVNTGSGYYAQDFAAIKELELSGTQLASGQVFTGTVTYNMAAVGYDMPAGQTFFRLGFILNGNGASQGVYVDNVRVSAVPEPASLCAVALAVSVMSLRRRR